jgi:hypothetical protein
MGVCVVSCAAAAGSSDGQPAAEEEEEEEEEQAGAAAAAAAEASLQPSISLQPRRVKLGCSKCRFSKGGCAKCWMDKLGDSQPPSKRRAVGSSPPSPPTQPTPVLRMAEAPAAATSPAVRRKGGHAARARHAEATQQSQASVGCSTARRRRREPLFAGLNVLITGLKLVRGFRR